MRVRFANRRERRVAISLFDNISKSWLTESEFYIRFGKTKEADKCREKVKRAQLMRAKIQSNCDFTVPECSECLDLLTHLPSNIVINDDNNMVERIKDRFGDAFADNSRTITGRGNDF